METLPLVIVPTMVEISVHPQTPDVPVYGKRGSYQEGNVCVAKRMRTPTVTFSPTPLVEASNPSAWLSAIGSEELMDDA